VSESVDEPLEPPEFDMSLRTADAIRARGGNLYLWLDKTGICARATMPSEAISYETFSSHGCSIRVDREIAGGGGRWRIAWKRFPWPHFAAVFHADSDGGDGGGIIDAILSAPWP
jgi:hypothetical protein